MIYIFIVIDIPKCGGLEIWVRFKKRAKYFQIFKEYFTAQLFNLANICIISTLTFSASSSNF
ncbi:unnamed protein product [Meloidogyne enterolobii]|uniref:Uncharacterized protein n=1 Tax=Meloidogyne enterolobii TaxID=390850 RepID=A0ACB1B741_MELEN